MIAAPPEHRVPRRVALAIAAALLVALTPGGRPPRAAPTACPAQPRKGLKPKATPKRKAAKRGASRPAKPSPKVPASPAQPSSPPAPSSSSPTAPTAPPSPQEPTVAPDTNVPLAPSPTESNKASADSESAPAVEAAPEIPAEPKARFEVRAFVHSGFRASLFRSSPALRGVLPELPTARAFVEGNAQPVLRVLKDRFVLAGDLSLYAATNDPQHLFLINELYVSSRIVGPVYLLAGRKRVIWGSALLYNPTDLVNPLKNPLDLEQQRTGAFLLPAIDVVTRHVTVSAFVSPRIKTNDWALPNDMRFDRMIAAARVYFLVAGLEANLMYFFDLDFKRHHGGLSLSRYFGTLFEAHAELLLSQGASTGPAVPYLPVCGQPPPSAFKKVTASLVAGGRFDLADQTVIGLEYLWNGNGFDDAGYQAYRAQLPCIREVSSMAPPAVINAVGHPIDPPVLMLRQHYLSGYFYRPHLTPELLADFSVGAAAIWSVEDLSLLLQARAAYRFGDRANVGLSGAYWVGRAGTEMTLAQTRLAGLVDVRVSY